MTRQQETIAAIVAAGGVIVAARTTRYVRVDFKGSRYWIGKMGGIREGVTVERSRSQNFIADACNAIIAKWFGPCHGIDGWDD